ncbi:MAG: polar amino acid transport system substrate-binding protein, partial [bacterium]
MKYFIFIFLWMTYSALSLQANEAVTVVTTHYPPFQIQENGSVKGMSTEVVRLLLKEAKISARFFIYPWSRAYKKAINNKNVLIYNISRTSKREKTFQWIAPITTNNVYLWKLKSRKDILIRSLEDLKKYSYGVLKFDVKRHYLEKQGVNLIEIVNRDKLNIKKLFRGRFDLMPYSEIAFVYQVKVLKL